MLLGDGDDTEMTPEQKREARRQARREERRRERREARRRAAEARKRPEAQAYRPKARMGPDGVMILEEDKYLHKAYYSGQQMPSPMGGFLMLLGVRPTAEGGAIALFECSASSLRYQMEIAKATRPERAKVKEEQAAGDDPDCPRHGSGHRLYRAGRDLVCPLCGIAYGKV